MVVLSVPYRRKRLVGGAGRGVGMDDKILDSLNSTCLRDIKPLATVLCAPERGPGAEF